MRRTLRHGRFTGRVGLALVVGLAATPARAEPSDAPTAPAGAPATRAERSPGERATRLDAQARYEEAAGAYAEALGAAGWQGEHVPSWVARLVELRLALGEPAAAGAVVAELERRPGAVPPLVQALLLLRLAEHHQRGGAPRQVLAELTPARLEQVAAAPVDLVVRLHAARGRALAATGQQAAGRAEYQRVPELWPGYRLAFPAIRASVADEPPAGPRSAIPMTPEEAERRFGQRSALALEVLDEELFLRAEAALLPAATTSAPRYRGAGDQESVIRFVTHEIRDWYEARYRALNEAMKGYKAVVHLEPSPSPIWVVAAGARVGELWADLAAASLNVPVAPSVRRDPKLARLYREALGHATEPLRQSARAALEICLGYAARYQISTRESERCAARLSELDPKGYPPLDELVPSPAWSPPFKPREAPLDPRRSAADPAGDDGTPVELGAP
ncbi:MAG: hypothetical protein JW940_13575 [Polyangiaceae bacterium]|nr:hypothetical protein [Polyangiaceae bacterium]